MEAVDDPYKIFALNVVSTYSDKELEDVLHSAKFIKRKIGQETRQADFYGDFLDCIMTELVSKNRDREVGHTLDSTADFFYGNFDIDRARREIKYYCEKFGRLSSVN